MIVSCRMRRWWGVGAEAYERCCRRFGIVLLYKRVAVRCLFVRCKAVRGLEVVVEENQCCIPSATLLNLGDIEL